MRHGLCGAQRVGKTTLANVASQELGFQFVQTDTRQVFNRIGRDPKRAYPIHERMRIQNEVFSALYEAWQANDNCIFDRTPLDTLAYLEADVLRDFPSDSRTVDLYFEYRDRCLDAVNLFSSIAFVQPGIKIVEEVGAAQGCLPYMEHYNNLVFAYIRQYVASNVFTYIMPSNVLDLGLRVSSLREFYNTIGKNHV